MAMQNFLMSQGQWKCVLAAVPVGKPRKVKTPASSSSTGKDVETTETIELDESAIESWYEAADKATGNIRLRIHHTISYQYNSIDNAYELWNTLKDKYGKPGITRAFLEFKGAMDTVIPGGSDPSPALDKISSHFARLKDLQLEVPEIVQVMIILAKAPPSMESVIQFIGQTEPEKWNSLEIVNVKKTMVLSWETSQRGKGKQLANKLSAVHRGPQNAPQFQQQQQNQQQRGDWQGGQGGRGKTRRSKRKGRQVAQQMQQAPPEQQNQPIAGPSTNIQFAAQRTEPQFGFLASPSIIPTPPTSFNLGAEIRSGSWKTFNRALDKAHALNVPISMENLKVLEMAEMAASSRPNKRPRVEITPRGNAIGKLGHSSSKQPIQEKDDDVVSLGWSEGQGPEDMDHQVGFEATTIEDADMDLFGGDPDAADHFGDDEQWQVSLTLQTEPRANLQTELDITSPSVQNKMFCLCSANQCECDTTPQEWMLDSGASAHFTGNIRDFIEVSPLEERIGVKTANSEAFIEGKGTIILALNPEIKVRIYPVYYVPTLTCRLLSLGTFLNEGLRCAGTNRSIQVLKGSTPFLTFHPRRENDSIYVIRSIQAADEGLYRANSSIYDVDYEIIHRRLGHPSKDVIQQARKHLKDFPKIEVPKKEHLCPGCALGKMSNRSFPAAPQRASKPFELIHSDLKSLPVESYHRFKYIIVFFDDYTSHTWTVNMRTKDAAISATKQFFAMVETKYGSKVKQWMSDAGGEYKSQAFDKMLKDRGIEILQSVPYAHQQNGRAERIIRTLMDKAEAMRHLACLPQSWWEFSVDHATHVYNRTPMRRLQWQTPFQLLNGERPSIDHLRVFGCGAYVFIPAETRSNKLAPKSELMIYLGNAPGAHGHMFMRSPNNVLYYATHSIFDESMFPRCQTQAKRPLTRLQEPAPTHHDHEDTTPVDEEDVSPQIPVRSRVQRQTTPVPSTQVEPPHTRQPTEAPRAPTPPVRRQDMPRPAPSLPVPVRRSSRTRKVPVREGNVYGDRHPVDILRDPKGKARAEPEPQPSSSSESESSGSSENGSPPAAKSPDKHSPVPVPKRTLMFPLSLPLRLKRRSRKG
jgi:transposase InsO family protein